MFQFSPYFLPLALVAVLAASAGYLGSRHPSLHTDRGYVMTMGSLTVWSLTVGFVLVSRPYDLKLFWFPAFLTATVYLVVGWFLFALSYTGTTDRLPRAVLWALVAIPVPFFVLTATNSLHGLVLVNPELVVSDDVARLRYEWGPVVWSYVGYTYVLAALATGLLFRKVLHTANVYRKLSFTVCIGGLSLWGANVVTFAGLSPFPHMLLVPFVFLFWGTIGVAVFTSSRFVQLLPIDGVLSTFSSRFDGVVGLGRDFVLEEMDSGVLILDEDDRLVDVNTMAKRMLGTRERLLGRRITELIDLDAYFDDPDEIGTADSQQEVIQVTANDGTERYYDIDITVLAGETGALIGRAVVMTDVTERHRATEYRHRLYEIISDPEASTDERLDRLLVLGCERLGVETGFLTRIENGTQYIRKAYGPDQAIQPGTECPLADTYCQWTIEQDGPLTVRRAGETDRIADSVRERFEIETYVGSKLMVDGEPYGTVCFADRTPRKRAFSAIEMGFIDQITRAVDNEIERHRYERDLKRQNERLEQFASVLSHDLRNPLGIAMGYLEVLAETAGEADSVARIRTAHDRMERIIEDVLTVARQGGSIDETRSVALVTVAERAWANVETGEVELVFDTSEKRRESDPDGDRGLGTIEADGKRVERLFENLFRNAIEHGDEATTVRLGRWSGGFYVEDDGPGIPAEQRGEIFDHGHTTSESGTGFGLSIVDGISEAHGWQVTATEGSNGGARFEIAL